jgi:phospholipid/cholesterol/gamma-HCH transport system substrate-binding protein
MRERSPRVVGLLSILVIMIGFGLAFSVDRFPTLRGVYSISADLHDAAGLQSGNEVRVAGVRVGRVTGVTLTPTAARVEMEVERDVRLPVETELEVKLKTLLGQKFIDLQVPRTFAAADDPTQATAGFLDDGDVIPKSQTSVPFEIYQAANEGTAVLEKIDKQALRKVIEVLGGTVGRSKQELRRALVSLSEVTDVLDDKGPEISALLRNTDHLTGTLAQSDEDIEGILLHGSDVLETLARRRATISSLLRATDDLTGNLAFLIQGVRGDIALGVTDLNSILLLVDEEMSTISEALNELGTAQEMFGQGLTMGRFQEGTICAVITEDTCEPTGSPENPGVPVKGRQPEDLPKQVMP